MQHQLSYPLDLERFCKVNFHELEPYQDALDPSILGGSDYRLSIILNGEI